VGTRDDVKEIRGLGLMIGIELTRPALPVVAACAERGLLTARAGDNVLRLVPPLIITEADCEKAVGIIAEAMGAG
jgi:acetylornithine/succinyldiaminopimelate/putrescine aminotransferase